MYNKNNMVAKYIRFVKSKNGIKGCKQTNT